MSPIRRSRTRLIRLRNALPFVALLASAACATRRPETSMPVARVAPDITWRIEEGDLIRTRVFGHTELDADPTVGSNGTAFFPGLGRVSVLGLTVDSLEALLNARYAAQVVRGAAVQVTMQRELTLYGAVRAPGVYAAGPGLTLVGFIAKAGGQAATSSSAPDVRLETADGRRFSLPREARLGTIEIHRNDALVLSEQGFFTRNATAIQAAQIVVSTLATLVSVVLIVSR